MKSEEGRGTDFIISLKSQCKVDHLLELNLDEVEEAKNERFESTFDDAIRLDKENGNESDLENEIQRAKQMIQSSSHECSSNSKESLLVNSRGSVISIENKIRSHEALKQRYNRKHSKAHA